MRTIKSCQDEVIETTQALLDSLKDPIKNFQAYLHWGTRSYYLTELLICWEMQKKKGYPYDLLLPLSLKLAKQRWKETSDFIHKYRNSPKYEEDMKRLEKEGF